MKQQIDYSITIAIGAPQSGVTTENKKHIARYIKEKKKQKQDYRVLVIDINHEYKGMVIESIDEIPEFKNKVALLRWDSDTSGEILRQMYHAINHFNGGLLVIGEWSKLPQHNAYAGKIIDMIVAKHRHKRLDILIGFLSPSKIPIRILQNVHYFRVHETIENIDWKKCPIDGKLGTVAQHVSTISKLKFAYIDLFDEKIFGCSEVEFVNCLKQMAQIFISLSNVRSAKQIKHQLAAINTMADKFILQKHPPISNIKREII